MSCRLDKYVWAVRLSKTRSQAAELVNKGKVRLNNLPVKPSKDVKIGDEIQLFKHGAAFNFRVLQILEKRVGAKLVDQYIIDLTSEEEKEKLHLFLSAQKVYKDKGTGKPSKKDRRDIDDFIENW